MEKQKYLLIVAVGILLLAASCSDHNKAFIGNWKIKGGAYEIEILSDFTCTGNFAVIMSEEPSEYGTSVSNEEPSPGLAYLPTSDPSPYATTITSDGTKFALDLRAVSITPTALIPKVKTLSDGSKMNVLQTSGKLEINGKWRFKEDDTIKVYVSGKSNDVSREFSLFSLALDNGSLKLSQDLLGFGLEGAIFLKSSLSRQEK